MEEKLDSFDQGILKEGGLALCDRFIQNCALRGKMPDVIILPDTTARPFAYLLKPILEEVARETGWKVPSIEFFRIDQDVDRSVLSAAKYHASFEDVLEGKTPAITKESGKYMQHSLQGVKSWKERAAKISQKLQKKGIDNPDIAIVDDYMTPIHATASAIRYAFSNYNIPAYAWMSSITTYKNTQDPLHTIGAVDNKNPYGRGKFHFVKQPGVGVVKKGQEKGMYAVPDETSGADKKQLRMEMRRIGEEIRDKLNIHTIIKTAKPVIQKEQEPDGDADDWMADSMI